MLPIKSSLLMLSLFSFFQFAQANENIRITNCQDLQNIEANLDGDYYLDNDIDCKGFNFKTIPGVFTGSIDGQYHTVSHLTTTAESNNDGGMFSAIHTVDVFNIQFNDVTIHAEDQVRRGLLAGSMSRSRLENVVIKGLKIPGHSTYLSKLNGTSSGLTGGIAGYAEHNTLLWVKIDGLKVRHHTYTGGLFGMARGMTIIHAGIYDMSSNLDPERDYPSSKKSIKYPDDKNPTVRNKFDTGMGGLIGFVCPTLNPEGFPHTVSIKVSRTSGDIAGPLNIGGIIGVADHLSIVTIENSYSSMNVKSDLFAGGIIGRAGEKKHKERFSRLANVYASGQVTSKKYARGMVGNQDEGGQSTHIRGEEAYFDTDATGRVHSGMKNAAGLPANKFLINQVNTFRTVNHWSNDVWLFALNQYPSLMWEEEI